MTPTLSVGAAAPLAGPAAPAHAPGRSFGAVLEALGVGGGRAPPPAASSPGLASAPASPAAPSPPPALRLLESVDRARARLDGVLAAARSGRTFTAQELLGLQAEAYRTVQTVDLAVKAAEQGAQSVRQALATQV